MFHRRSAIAPLIAAATLAPLAASAWSLFSSERSRLWDEAEKARDKAAEERAEGRVMGEIEALSDVGRTLADIATRFPEYKAEEVEALRIENAERMRELMTAVRSGEIAVPEPDAAWRGDDVAAVDTRRSVEPAAPADGPAFRLGIPELVRVESQEQKSATAPSAATGAESAESTSAVTREDMAPEQRRIRSSIPNPFFNSGIAPIPAPARDESASLPQPPKADSEGVAPPPAPLPSPAEPSASVSVSVRNIKPSVPLPSSDDPRVQLRAVGEMIKTARAPDAVILLEDIVRAPGAEPPLEARTLLVRALLELGNYQRAAEELKAFPKSSDSDPSVRTLRASVCVATGDTPEAFRQLSSLIDEHPDWSDAYVDCAYVMFLMNPKENRDDAIDLYRRGLSNGAHRDPRLERELRVKVGD